jgi:hypothetical protein
MLYGFGNLSTCKIDRSFQLLLVRNFNLSYYCIHTMQCYDSNRWLSLFETCMELRLGERAVLALLRRGLLVGYRLPRRGRHKWGEWRILDPGAQFSRYIQESKRPVEHVQMLSSRELAEVLGVKPGTIRQMKKRGQIQGKKVGKTTLYSAGEVRRFVFNKERSDRGSGRQMYSPILAKWLRGILQKDEHIGGQVLGELLDHVVAIPAPDKSCYITELWDHFGAISDLLRSARRREDFSSAFKKLKPFGHQYQPTDLNF